MRYFRTTSIPLAVLIFWVASVHAQTPVEVPVPEGSGTTEIFEFLTPSPTSPQNEIVARFLVDKLAPSSGQDLTFTVEGHRGGYVLLADVVLGQTGQTVSDTTATSNQQAAFVEATLPMLTADRQPVDGRVIEITVTFLPTHTFVDADQGQTWSVRARRNIGPLPAEFNGFVEQGTDATALRNLVDRAKLRVSPAALVFGNETQINMSRGQHTPVLNFTWTNVGPGLFTPTGALEDGIPVPFHLEGSPSFVPLKPAEESEEATIEFAPTQMGLVNETLEINGTNGVKGTSDLTGTGIDLTAILLLDVSGSMDRHYMTGDYGSHEEADSRLGQAKLAGKQLFTAYQGLTGGQSKFGLYTFPDPANNSSASADRTVPNNLPLRLADAFTAGEIGVALGDGPNRLVAGGNTPMHAGLVLAEGDLDLQPWSRTHERPIILLLSDGKHNTPSRDQAPVNFVNSSEWDDAVRIYSVPYGTIGDADVDRNMLQSLADNTEGKMFSADPTVNGALAKAFRGALSEWLELRGDDPESSITANQSKTHEVCVDDKAYQAVFVVDWYDNRDDAISFTLETPLGITLVPSSPDLSFTKDRSYAMYVVYGRHVRGGKGAGLWKLKLTGSASLPGTLGYQYSVMTQAVNPPKLNWTLVPGLLAGVARPLEIYAGEKWFLEMLVDPELKARIDGSETGLQVRLDAPSNSVGTFLARSTVKREWIFTEQKAKGLAPREATRQQEPLPIAARKARALAEFDKIRFVDKRVQTEHRLSDDGQGGDRVAGDNIYSIELPAPKFDGDYSARVLLNLAPVGRDCAKLNTVLWKYVPPNFATTVISENLQWRAVSKDIFFDPSVYNNLELGSAPPRGKVRQAAVFTAKDKYGNYLGPGQASQIQFDAKNGHLVGPVVDNWDGSYIQVVEYTEGADPALSITAGGFKNEPAIILPKPESEEPSTFPVWLLWVLIVIVLILFVDFIIKKLRSNP